MSTQDLTSAAREYRELQAEIKAMQDRPTAYGPESTQSATAPTRLHALTPQRSGHLAYMTSTARPARRYALPSEQLGAISKHPDRKTAHKQTEIAIGGYETLVSATRQRRA